jgi:hypothetical protein
MKKSTFIFLFPIFLFVFIFKTYSQENAGKEYVKKPKGTAILITGAAARIPQEAACLKPFITREC